MNAIPRPKADVGIDFVDLTPHIGTEVRGLDLSKPLGVATIDALRSVWLHRALLVFRGQKLSQENLVQFTKYFGDPGNRAGSPSTWPPGYARVLPEIMLISNIRENGQTIGALPDGELNFHHDMIQTEIPHNASILYSLEIPSYGGDTCFAAGHAAYDSLDNEIKAKLEGKRVFHYYQYGTTKRGDKTGGVDSVDRSLHPAFRTHDETQRKAIYVNRLMSMKVDGLDEEEGQRLLSAVFDHAEKSEFIYRHKWKVGDVLMWDNRNSMHARTDFPSDQRRLMWRTTIRGTKKPY